MKRIGLGTMLAALVMGGMALAQTPEFREARVQRANEIWRAQDHLDQCLTEYPAGYHDVNDVIQHHDGASYRCAYVYDKFMVREHRPQWVRVKP